MKEKQRDKRSVQMYYISWIKFYLLGWVKGGNRDVNIEGVVVRSREIAGAGGQAAESSSSSLWFLLSLFWAIHHPATLRHNDQISPCHFHCRSQLKPLIALMKIVVVFVRVSNDAETSVYSFTVAKREKRGVTSALMPTGHHTSLCQATFCSAHTAIWLHSIDELAINEFISVYTINSIYLSLAEANYLVVGIGLRLNHKSENIHML